MPVKRLAIANPSANVQSTLYTADGAYIASVIAANKSANSINVDIAVIPVGETLATAAYIIDNISIAGGQSFETFKFALNTGDSISVIANSAAASFLATGLYEAEGRQIVSYQLAAPNYPQIGDIWINSSTQATSFWNGSAWSTSVSVGPTGPTGSTGAAGTNGATGATGPSAASGRWRGWGRSWRERRGRSVQRRVDRGPTAATCKPAAPAHPLAAPCTQAESSEGRCRDHGRDPERGTFAGFA